MTDAAIAYERVVVGSEGVTLSKLIWRRFREHKPGMVERILDRQGALSAAMTLPVGAVVEIPIDAPATQTRRKVVTLWD